MELHGGTRAEVTSELHGGRRAEEEICRAAELGSGGMVAETRHDEREEAEICSRTRGENEREEMLGLSAYKTER